MIETKEQALELLIKAMPYPEQMKNFDMSEPDCIYFTWRSLNLRFSFVFLRFEEVDGSVLIGSDACIILSKLIKSIALA